MKMSSAPPLGHVVATMSSPRFLVCLTSGAGTMRTI